MRLDTHDPRTAKTRKRQGLRPRAEALEQRLVMSASIDLIGDAASPYGVNLNGSLTGGGAGFSVAEVGDVNGDGFNDFVVGASGVTGTANGPAPSPGATSRAYLIFGSRAANGTLTDFLSLTATQRLGALSALNTLNQTNGFDFSGVEFSTSTNQSGSLLGASVKALGDINGDNKQDFIIGAPGAAAANGTLNNAGRAYIIFGSTAFNTIGTINLDIPPAQTTGISIITIENDLPTAANSLFGYSVASAGNFLGEAGANSRGEVAIGAPQTSSGGLTNNGAVYVITNSAINPPQPNQVILLSQLGSTVGGVTINGATSNGLAGFSVSNGGNFAGLPGTDPRSSTLLVGSPGPVNSANSGVATLIYGSNRLPSTFLLNQVGTSLSNGTALTGIVFQGQTGDGTGFSVSAAADFDTDGVDDIIIGSPYFNTDTGAGNAGRATVVLGSSTHLITSTSASPYNLTLLRTASSYIAGQPITIELDGSNSGDLAGFSVSLTGTLANNNGATGVIVGAPGVNSLQGQAYIIPGNPDLVGVHFLQDDTDLSLSQLIIGITPTTAGTAFLGSSVSGLIRGSGNTVDGDIFDDPVVGAAAYPIDPTQSGTGGSFLLEGGLLPIPVANRDGLVSTEVAVDSTSGTAPFPVDAQKDLLIYLNPDPSIPITPATDLELSFPIFVTIGSTTYTATGVAQSDGSVLVTIPKASLQLANGNDQTVIVRANILFTADGEPNPYSFNHRLYTGVTTIDVTNATPPNQPGNGNSRFPAFFGLGGGNSSNLPFGERLVPTNAILRRLTYKPIPIQVAHKQFLPTNGFAFRNHQFFHPSKKNNKFGNSNTKAATGGVYTLKSGVYTRSRFPSGTFKGHIKARPHTIG